MVGKFKVFKKSQPVDYDHHPNEPSYAAVEHIMNTPNTVDLLVSQIMSPIQATLSSSEKPDLLKHQIVPVPPSILV